MDFPETLTLVSYEGKEFSVPGHILRVSYFLQQMPEYNEKIHLSICGIDSDTLRLILSYCHHYRYDFPLFKSTKLVSCTLSEHLQDPWEGQFIESLSLDTLAKVLDAATKLEIVHLQDLCCMRIATLMKKLTVENIEEELGIEVGDLEQYEPFLKEVHSNLLEPTESEVAQDEEIKEDETPT